MVKMLLISRRTSIRSILTTNPTALKALLLILVFLQSFTTTYHGFSSAFALPTITSSTAKSVKRQRIFGLKDSFPARGGSDDDGMKDTAASNNNNHDNTNNNNSKNKQATSKPNDATSSKGSMLQFAIPALGIYLMNPLLSNIDNAFVGRTAGTQALAAMSPGTTISDLLLMMFSFLGRATTGIVSRAYHTTTSETTTGKQQQQGDAQAASAAASAPFTMALVCGIALTLIYEFLTPTILDKLGAKAVLRPQASSYIYWRGSVAWAALAQTVCLSCLLVTRDSVTPLKIVALAAVVNVIGDALFCVWPFQLGCAGAAAATAIATLFSATLMIRALVVKKGIVPKLKIPTKHEFKALLQFTGPLMAITFTRIGGFFAMQRAASKLGTQSLAGYQICIHIMMFFLLFGEPLSQLSQTKLPILLDTNNKPAVKQTIQSAMSIASSTALLVASCAFMAARFGSRLMISSRTNVDASVVQGIAQSTSPVLFLTIATAVISVAFDGAQIAAKDFGYMLVAGFATFLLQLKLLPRCTTVPQIFGTFCLRMGIYAVISVLRAFMGYGGVGRVLRNDDVDDTLASPAVVT